MEGAAEEAAAGSGTTADPSFNERVAQEFRTAADLLEAQGAEPFRVQAYRRAASTVESMLESVADVYAREGEEGLIALPTIGRALALAIEDLVERGSWRWLERLQGETDPEALLCTVAGIGPTLAARLHHELDIETLEDLELAAYDGRLAQLGGFGPKRIRAIADSLAADSDISGLSTPPPTSTASRPPPNCSTSTGSTGPGPRPARSPGSRHDASTPPTNGPSRSCTPTETAATTPPCGPTPRALTACTAPATGW